MAKKNVYSFGGGKADGNESMKNLLGGKGANLAEMAGHPKLRSIPSKPISINFFAALKKFSGRVPHIWATRGRSSSVYCSR